MPKPLFQCMLCNRIHSTMEQAATCEKSHIGVQEIQSLSFNPSDKPKYPQSIKCKMLDGKVIEFWRHP